MPTQIEKYETFRALHKSEQAFLMPNPWDAGTARLLTEIGFPALATTSAGYAFSAGKRDSFAALSRDELLANASDIVAATHLPVSADLEDGFGQAPETCAETVRMACDCGLVGGSIEDATGDTDDPICEMDLAVARIEAAVEVSRDLPFILTARAENFLWGHPDLEDTIRRLRAFADAGADVLYAPGLPDIAAIDRVCREVGKPVNVVMGLQAPSFTVQELSDAGVQRVSVGGSFARAAMGALKRAAQEVWSRGTFDYASEAMPGKDLSRIMSKAKSTDRR